MNNATENGIEIAHQNGPSQKILKTQFNSSIILHSVKCQDLAKWNQGQTYLGIVLVLTF